MDNDWWNFTQSVRTNVDYRVADYLQWVPSALTPELVRFIPIKKLRSVCLYNDADTHTHGRIWTRNKWFLMDSSKTIWKGYHTMQRSNSSWQDVTEILPYVHMFSAYSLPHALSSFHPLPTFSANSTPLGKPPTKCTHAIPKHICSISLEQ